MLLLLRRGAQPPRTEPAGQPSGRWRAGSPLGRRRLGRRLGRGAPWRAPETSGVGQRGSGDNGQRYSLCTHQTLPWSTHTRTCRNTHARTCAGVRALHACPRIGFVHENRHDARTCTLTCVHAQRTHALACTPARMSTRVMSMCAAYRRVCVERVRTHVCTHSNLRPPLCVPPALSALPVRRGSSSRTQLAHHPGNVPRGQRVPQPWPSTPGSQVLRDPQPPRLLGGAANTWPCLLGGWQLSTRNTGPAKYRCW